jgi:hypothetical protein
VTKRVGIVSRAEELGAPTHMTRIPTRACLSTLSTAFLAVALAAGCGSSTPALTSDGGPSGSGGKTGSAGSGSPQGGGGMTGNAGTTGAAGQNVGVDAGTKIPIGQTQCSNGIDDDKDGLADFRDPECTGPNDNDEGTYATGIPGDNIDACKQDCFFDGNSGMGDDGCLWQLKCDQLSTNTKCPYDKDFADKHTNECSVSMSQPQKCIDNCRKYVPNGCDCFGCCAVPGAPTPIHLDPTCTAKDFGDPTKCSPCTQVTQCMNPCDRCEVCVGKPTVPADCGYTPPPVDGGTPYDAAPPKDGGYGIPTCTNGVACGSEGECPAKTACVTGCCLPFVE